MRGKTTRKLTTPNKTTNTYETKRATTQNHATFVLECHFNEIPTPFVSPLRLAFIASSQQENMRQLELNRTDIQKKNLNKQQATLIMPGKQRPSAHNKKTTHEHHKRTQKTAPVLSRQQGQMKNEIQTIATKQAKYAAIPTLLSKFNKQWEQKVKKAKITANKSHKKTGRKQKLSIDAATPVLENASFRISAVCDA